MAERSFRHHLPPQELARRQRWVAVGVTILTILLVATWLVTLPGRFASYSPQHTWDAWWGKSPDTTYINIDQMMNGIDDSGKNITQVMQAAQASLAASSTPTSATTPATIPTSTINILKAKLK